MARPILVLDEVIALLELSEVPTKVIDRVRTNAQIMLERKGWSQRELDNIVVSSGFGQASQHGHVELVINDQSTQMDVKKATEIGLMLLQAAEAAQSDEIMIRLLEDIGLPPAARANMLLKLREIRQGTRGTSRPQ